MLVTMFDDRNPETQKLERSVSVVPSRKGSAIYLHSLAGFVSECLSNDSTGTWVIYVGF